MFTLIKDAVRKTYKELEKGRADFTGFLTDARLVTLSFSRFLFLLPKQGWPPIFKWPMPKLC